LPVLGGITQTLLTIVLMFFLLYDRKGLRDRLVRVAARGGIVISSQAIHDATAAVSWYLLLFSTINLLFGVAVALAAWIINVPRPMLWGLVAFVMRFLPYVGSIAAAALPTLVAFAVFPTSAPAFEVLASFVLLDQLAAQFAEPFLIGPGIGIAPVAYLISAIFWAWLWGPFGLLLSVPLTVCLKVAGDHIPELRSIAILLGSEERLEEYHDYYRNLLEMDRQGARQLAIRCCDELGLERTFNELFVPTLALSVNELAKNNITPQNQQIINETTRELIVELGDRFLKPRATPRMRVLGVCAPGEEHALGVLMLLELLRIDGFAANFVGDDKSAAEVTEHATRFGPDLLFVFCSKPQNGKAAVEMVRKIRLALPRVPIVAAGEGSAAMAKELLGAGCQQVMLALRGARRAIGRIALRRPRERQVPVQVENENYDRSADNPAPNSGDHQDLAAGSPRGSRQWLGRALSEVRHYFSGE
jgi:hypothetical protein